MVSAVRLPAWQFALFLLADLAWWAVAQLEVDLAGYWRVALMTQVLIPPFTLVLAYTLHAAKPVSLKETVHAVCNAVKASTLLLLPYVVFIAGVMCALDSPTPRQPAVEAPLMEGYRVFFCLAFLLTWVPVACLWLESAVFTRSEHYQKLLPCVARTRWEDWFTLNSLATALVTLALPAIASLPGELEVLQYPVLLLVFCLVGRLFAAFVAEVAPRSRSVTAG